MPNQSTITWEATKYGTSNYGVLGHAYIGGGYRSRLTFHPINKISEIGNSNIIITKATLKIRRDDGGPTDVTFGCSGESDWGITADAYSQSFTISNETKWYEIDITPCAPYIAKYTGNWHLHATGSNTTVRCDGVDAPPSIAIEWEYAGIAQYGIDNKWQTCLTYYGENGQWKQVIPYYGVENKWQQV